MQKHLYAMVALAAVVGVGFTALAAAPPSQDKTPQPESKVVAEEPKGNTGETTPQPSTVVEGNSEFNEPSRSPAERYTRMDPAFAKYVDLLLLVEAMAGPNVSLLADVALGLAEGERVLVRKHRTGLTSEALMVKVTKLAARSNDKATLERIVKASTSLNKPQWAKLVADAKEFTGVSRDGPMVALGKIDVTTVALLERVRKACDVAELTGWKRESEYLKTEITAADVDSKFKTYLMDMIDGCAKSLTGKPDEVGRLLEEFSATSRAAHYVTFSNTSMTDTLNVAIVYYVPGSSELAVEGYWACAGWWVLRPQQASTLYVGEGRTFYYYAREMNGKYWYSSPAPQFKVKYSSKFDYSLDTPAALLGPGYTPVGFLQTSTDSGPIKLGG